MHLLAEATTKFTLELYRQLRETEDNIFYSPISIMTALGMLQLGAKGNTRQQIEKVGVSFIPLTSLNLSLHHSVSVQMNDDKARGLRWRTRCWTVIAMAMSTELWEGHTLPKHGPDTSWTAFGCWWGKLPSCAQQLEVSINCGEHWWKLWIVSTLRGWTEVFPGQQANRHYSHAWRINFWCFVQLLY